MPVTNVRPLAGGLVLAVALAACTAGGVVTGEGSTKSPVVASKPSPSGPVAPTVDQNIDPYTRPQLAETKAITGVQYRSEPNHTHILRPVTYDTSPPTGGDHSAIWADCSGTVYLRAIANETAVHMLEHGTVWITYKTGLAADQVATLSRIVAGVDRMALSPYPDLQSNISLQAWGYQLFVDDAADPRIAQFVAALRNNPNATPESGAGVPCANPVFKQHPSTFGTAIFQY